MVAIGNQPQRPELANVDFLGSDLGRSGSLYGSVESGVYTGKHFDVDLQAYVFPYRFYRPDLLRWTTPDPIGYPDGWNAFAYVGDPVTYRDRLGLEPEYVHDFGQLDIKPSAAAGNGGVAKLLSFFAPGSPTLHLKAKYGENLDPNTSINHPMAADAVPGGTSSGQTSGEVINFEGQISYSYKTGPIPTLEGSMRKEKEVEEETHYYWAGEDIDMTPNLTITPSAAAEFDPEIGVEGELDAILAGLKASIEEELRFSFSTNEVWTKSYTVKGGDWETGSHEL